MENQIKKALNILIECAKDQKMTYYGTIYEDLGLACSNVADRNKGSDILGKVSDITMADNEVMISALVVSKETNKPYDGFFKLASNLGKIGRNINEFEKIKFWVKEVEKVFNVYKKQ